MDKLHKKIVVLKLFQSNQKSMIFFAIIGIMTVISFLFYLIKNWNNESNQTTQKQKAKDYLLNNTPTPMMYLKASNQMFTEGHYLMALFLCEEAIKLEPDNPMFKYRYEYITNFIEKGIQEGNLDMKEQMEDLENIMRKTHAVINQLKK